MIDPLILFRGVHIAATPLAVVSVAFIARWWRNRCGAACVEFSVSSAQTDQAVGSQSRSQLSEAEPALLSAEIYGAPVIAVCSTVAKRRRPTHSALAWC